MPNCLYCYKPLAPTQEGEYHPACAKKFFGTVEVPVLPLREEHLYEHVLQQNIAQQVSVTGFQKKLSLEQAGHELRTVLDAGGGRYILKVPNPEYAEIVEWEHLTMLMAQAAGIATVPCTLYRLPEGNLAYLTRRIDRKWEKGQLTRIHMEDFCQLLEFPAAEKYRGSYERIAKKVVASSVVPDENVLSFFNLVLFSFLTLNADMHLKNFSLWYPQPGKPEFAPAYDLLPSQLIEQKFRKEDEELALTLNGKKNRLKWEDFAAAMSSVGILPKVQENLVKRLQRALPKWKVLIDHSYVSAEQQVNYWTLIHERLARLTER